MSEETKKMNVVLFFADEMRASSVSAYGNKIVDMPHYDKLAREGVLFANCIVQNPVCSPSRISLMTGRYVHTAGHRTLWHLLRPHEHSLFRYLIDGGYDVAWYGKNDLYSEDYLEEIQDGISRKIEHSRYDKNHPERHVHGGDNPYDIDDPLYYSFLYPPIPCNEDEIRVDMNVENAVDYLESRQESDKPFMLYLPLSMPHPPYHALEPFHNLYDHEDVQEHMIAPNSSEGKPSYIEKIRQYRGLDKLDDSIFAKIYATYLGMNSYTDYLLGQILDALDRTGLSDNTCVIVCSDHGDWAGNHGLVEKWPNAMDDDLVRVPLIIRMPGNKAGHRVDEQVELFDIMPTVMDCAGLDIKHTHYAKSLIDQIYGSSGDPKRAVFCEGGYDLHEPHCFEGFAGRHDGLLDPHQNYYPKAKMQIDDPSTVCRSTMVRTMTHKLVKRTSGEHELYDLVQDPHELVNRYHNEVYQGVRYDLESQMLDWYIKTADAVPFDDDKRSI